MADTFEMRCTCPPTRWEKGDAAHDPGCPLGEFIAGRLGLQKAPGSAVDELAPELLAQLWWELRRGHETWLPNWNVLGESAKRREIDIAGFVLAELERRAISQPMGMLVSKLSDGQIRVDFSKKIKRFDIKRDAAINFAITVLNQCGVELEIKTTLPPAPGDPV